MPEQQLCRLPIVDRDKRLVGIASLLLTWQQAATSSGSPSAPGQRGARGRATRSGCGGVAVAWPGAGPENGNGRRYASPPAVTRIDDEGGSLRSGLHPDAIIEYE